MLAHWLYTAGKQSGNVFSWVSTQDSHPRFVTLTLYIPQVAEASGGTNVIRY